MDQSDHDEPKQSAEIEAAERVLRGWQRQDV
jgi:hypothetical protein